MLARRIFFSTLSLAGIVLYSPTPVSAYGLIGYGITQNKPFCAFACQMTVAGYNTTCGPGSLPTSSKADSSTCLASNTPYLQSLAYCIEIRCPDVPGWRLERFWEAAAITTKEGESAVAPKISYSQSLATLTKPPNATLKTGAILRSPVMIPHAVYQLEYSSIAATANNNIRNSDFAYVDWRLSLSHAVTLHGSNNF
jgi:hypothetical protein